MGCDIHCIFERKVKYDCWINSGDPDIGRNYIIFSILAGVRNYDEIPSINYTNFGLDDEDEPNINTSREFANLLAAWESDAHTQGYVTLRQLKKYDITHEKYCRDLILNKDSNGKIMEVCRSTTGKHYGPVGKTDIFGPWGPKCWLDFIKYGQNIREFHSIESDEDIRLIFFFDN